MTKPKGKKVNIPKGYAPIWFMERIGDELIIYFKKVIPLPKKK